MIIAYFNDHDMFPVTAMYPYVLLITSKFLVIYPVVVRDYEIFIVTMLKHGIVFAVI